jgi:hypothetical protein
MWSESQMHLTHVRTSANAMSVINEDRRSKDAVEQKMQKLERLNAGTTQVLFMAVSVCVSDARLQLQVLAVGICGMQGGSQFIRPRADQAMK